jgi:thioredoxin-related protein
MNNTPESRTINLRRMGLCWLTAIALWICLFVGSCSFLQSGPPLGSSLPPFNGTDSCSNRLSVSPSEAPCILFFYSAQCYPCSQLLEVITSCLEQSGRPKPKVVLLIRERDRADSTEVIRPGFRVIAISSKTWGEVFQAKRTPMLLFYNSGGKLVRKQLGWRPALLQQRILDQFSTDSAPADLCQNLQPLTSYPSNLKGD